MDLSCQVQRYLSAKARRGGWSTRGKLYKLFINVPTPEASVDRRTNALHISERHGVRVQRNKYHRLVAWDVFGFFSSISIHGRSLDGNKHVYGSAFVDACPFC